MRVRLPVVLTLVAAALTAVSAQTNATGRCNMTISTDQGSIPTTLTSVQEGEALSGSMASDQGTVEFDGGTISGNKLAWVIEVVDSKPHRSAAVTRHDSPQARLSAGRDSRTAGP